ncbi:MAG TPA: ATP-binding protein [Candidatus Sulfotelmatobacter sp.]|nr:ATP-binding protein [Candidatus Sulfotelmatobacter sp.]
MNTALIDLTPETPWSFRDQPIIVGKDILEVLSNAMYVDPLAIYREYIQNAADAIDEARTGVLSPRQTGTVEIEIDIERRTVIIRDNGTGIPAAEFENRLTSFGASVKRGTTSRGFRGVGRLSGLAYCQELLFRSRSAGESVVSELRWDCRKAKTLLRSADFAGDLSDVVAQSVQVRRTDAKKRPEHFFEVELRNIQRLRNDWLLNPTVIEEYLSQVAPLPFAPQFRFADDITAMLGEHTGLTDITLKVAGKVEPTFRPHRDSFDIANGKDNFEELQKITIPGYDGGTAAVGWVLHHGYRGAVPDANLKGLRLRSGNMQIGTNGILEDLFIETRFNSWSVGEIHVIDSRIVPNGRRDHYEQNVHYTNLINQLSPIAREISNRCRTSSAKRNWLRQFELQKAGVIERVQIIRQGSVTPTERKRLETDIASALHTMGKVADKAALSEARPLLRRDIKKLEQRLAALKGRTFGAKPLAALPPSQRRASERIFSLIYECSPNRIVAKSLVDKILSKLF